MLVSVVIPCYNSEHTIEKVVDECMKAFEQWDGYECEMVLVNDFSKDRTFEAICRACDKYPNVKGVNLAKNFGQHAAIMAALQYVQGDLVVGMDDDLQNHPTQIRQFLDAAEQGYDVVFGVFKKRKFTMWKNITGAISRFVLWRLLDRPKDIQMSSFWLARRYVTDEARKYDGNTVFVQLIFFRTTFNMCNIEIDHYSREVGTSNYTFRKSMRLFMTFLNFTVLPLRLATFFGAAFSSLGLLSAIVTVIRKLLDPTIQSGWSSLFSAMLVLFGFTFLMLGIIGEYVGNLIQDSTHNPQYVIRETVNTRLDTDRRELPQVPGKEGGNQ